MDARNTVDVMEDLAVFALVAQRGGFSSAAQALSVTPSAVSKQVSRLEKHLGVKLLVRSTRTMFLTDVGQEVLLHAQAMLQAAQTVRQIAQNSMAQPCGKVAVAAPKAFAWTVLQPLIPLFLAQYPQVSVQIMVTDLSADTMPEGADCALMITSNPPELYIAKPLRPVKQFLCASPTYLAQYGVPDTPQALSEHQCIALGEVPNDRRWVLQRGDEVIKVMVQGRYTVNHSGMRLDGVLRGLGIGALPEFVVRESLQSGLLVEILPEWRLLSRYQGQLWLVYASNRFVPPALAELLAFLKQHLMA